jgi:hypothetical protein
MSTAELSRRKFLALTAAAAAQAATPMSIFAAPTPPVAPRAGVQSLAGQWRFSLDRDDIGVKSSWFSKDLTVATKISLPGILQTQGYGDDIVADTKFIAALPRDMAWYKLPQYAEYTKPGHVLVPYLSQPVKHYLGVAWYQRDIDIPATWAKKRVGLTLERTRWQTTVYVDDKEIGNCHSLVAPHDYDLGILTPGKHRLSIRIDNSMLYPYRYDAHSVSDAEGSTWNGIVGRIELSATTPVWIDDAQVFPNVADKSAHIKVHIGNLTGKSGSGTFSVGATTASVSWDATGGGGTIDVPLPTAKPWSEFTPILQHLTLKLTGPSADDHRDLTFGLREIKSEGKHILLNGELFSLRATHDGGGFPLTGYPATDVTTWKRIISICKTWGLNGIRFHSWCPPEAAFTAGDELGFYFQPECGMWSNFDAEGKMLALLNDETARLLKAYGNHPSFVMLDASNEPAGSYQQQLGGWDKQWHDTDPRRLYGDGTGRPVGPPLGLGRPNGATTGAPGQPPAAPGPPAVARPGQPAAAAVVSQPFTYTAGYNVTGGRGASGWFGADYERTLSRYPIPVIGHEVGQWCAYPDFDVIKKFSGPNTTFAGAPEHVKVPYMIPGNYEIMRDSAKEHGLLAKNKEFAHASGRFQVACYKEEIEASLRTPSFSGFEILDLHDYLGQGGALIGMLDAFWETKGYAGPTEFRQWNNTTVPLSRFKDRVYTTANTFTSDIEVAHFGAAPIANVTSHWSIVAPAGKVVASGTFPARALPRGKGIALGKVSADLSKFPAPAQYKLVVELHAGASTFKNDWNFWLYPANVDATVPPSVIITSSWLEAEARLASGGKVLFLPKGADLDSTDPRVSTVPIFWNHLMNPNGTTFLGLWNDTKHPALAGFPTESNCDWQWVDITGNTRALNIDTLPKSLQPIVQSIDDWNRNWKLALLYECSVGTGQLMVCSLDLDAKRVGTPSLRRSILDYMASAKFKPTTAVEVADLRKHWFSLDPNHVDPGASRPAAPTSPDLVDPGQIQRRPTPPTS